MTDLETLQKLKDAYSDNPSEQLAGLIIDIESDYNDMANDILGETITVSPSDRPYETFSASEEQS